MPSFRAVLLALLLTLAAAGPAAAQAPTVPPLTVPGGATDPVPQVPDVTGTTPAGPDAVMSDNVEYLGSIKQDEGLTTGAKVIGDRMFVTSGKNISIYDISDPAKPKNLGGMKANVAWENEEVPTNGKVLAVASDFYSIGVPECVAALAADGCVQLFDVRDPANIKQVGTIPVANHTAECVLDCQYFYGRAGTIIDARGVLDGKAPTVIGNWIDELKAQGVEEKSCHHIREIRPGVLLTACQPFAAISVNAADGGSPAHPKVLYTGEAAKFVHSARWPRSGRDKFVLIGGEQNFTGRCERNNSEFSVYGAGNVLKGRSTQFEGPISQVPPAGNGVYADGKPVAGALGCSVHWFQEHASFKNGGLVAISEYEDGVRFLQITQGRQDHRAGLLPLARQLVLVAEVGRQGRRPVLDRLPARHRHPALEGQALRAGQEGARHEARHQRRHASRRRRRRRRPRSAPRSRASCARRAGRRWSAAWWRAAADPAAPYRARRCGTLPRMALDPRVPPRRLAAPRVDAFVRRRYRTLSGRAAPSGDLDRATLQGFRRLVDRAAGASPAPSRLDKTVAHAFRALARADLDGSRPSPPIRRAIVDQFHRLYYHSSSRRGRTRASSACGSGRARSTSGSTRS